MINKRKLNEVIYKAIDSPERDCGYTYEEVCAEPFYQRHVCEYVSTCWLPLLLADYLYSDCYYNDIKLVKANVSYINTIMRKRHYHEMWTDMTLESVLEIIEQHKEDAAIKAATRGDDSDLIDLILESSINHGPNSD